jgi:dienelactone hydrolase
MTLRSRILAAGVLLSLAARAAGGDVPWLAEVQTAPAAVPPAALAPLWPADAVPRSKEDWAVHRDALRRRWFDLLGPMPERPSSTSITVLRTDRLPDVTRTLIEYENEPGQRVQAYLLRPVGTAAAQSRAGVVALHPTTKETIEPIAGVVGDERQHTGLKLAQRGFVVLCPRCFLWQDAPDYQTAVANFRARHPQTLGMHKMLYDAQRAVDILAAQDDVDPARIGACGHSLGAKETLYLAAFDERIRAAVFSEGGVGLKFSNWEAPWYLGPGIREPGFARDHHELLALIAPRPFLILAGEQGPGAADGDRSWPYIAAALPVCRLFGEPPRLGLYNHRQGHTVSAETFERWAQWLTVYLSESG